MKLSTTESIPPERYERIKVFSYKSDSTGIFYGLQESFLLWRKAIFAYFYLYSDEFALIAGKYVGNTLLGRCAINSAHRIEYPDRVRPPAEGTP